MACTVNLGYFSRMPSFVKADFVQVDTLITQVDEVDASTIYQGYAAQGSATSAAVWKIRRVTVNSNNTVTVTYADGDQHFNNVWDNRASLSYS